MKKKLTEDQVTDLIDKATSAAYGIVMPALKQLGYEAMAARLQASFRCHAEPELHYIQKGRMPKDDLVATEDASETLQELRDCYVNGKQYGGFDEKETATILAALRLFQKKYEEGKEDANEDFPDHFQTVGPLESEEIDNLCEKINFGD